MRPGEPRLPPRNARDDCEHFRLFASVQRKAHLAHADRGSCEFCSEGLRHRHNAKFGGVVGTRTRRTEHSCH